jgi:hypothetical protein
MLALSFNFTGLSFSYGLHTLSNYRLYSCRLLMVCVSLLFSYCTKYISFYRILTWFLIISISILRSSCWFNSSFYSLRTFWLKCYMCVSFSSCLDFIPSRLAASSKLPIDVDLPIECVGSIESVRLESCSIREPYTSVLFYCIPNKKGNFEKPIMYNHKLVNEIRVCCDNI